MPKSKHRRRKAKAQPSDSASVGRDQARELAALAEEDPIEAAAQLVDLAWDVADLSLRKDYALKALDVDPLCSDALLVLADSLPKGSNEQRTVLLSALDLAETRLGEKAFRTCAGEFWLVLETRPYMRARISLAESLRAAGDLDGARQHYVGLLELCPNDNLGARFILATVLHLTNRLEELETLLRRYEEDGSVFWAYAGALLEFKRNGAATSSNDRLAEAMHLNAFVPGYLLGNRKLRATSPDYYSPGDRSEAEIYAAANVEAWRRTPGALAWLRDRRGGRKS